MTPISKILHLQAALANACCYCNPFFITPMPKTYGHKH
jgi:hypothetical protein